ncbi:hypothetical protein SETIT_3G116200v2 [Setaria italica]|uniref:Uncharacterized protein n=1 Tax=Setaria italica TaxID=4555 RepID=A0A368QDV8_SETIT|nr:hypothetical protein SETIT_3G116200v2 [Setaria italica]
MVIPCRQDFLVERWKERLGKVASRCSTLHPIKKILFYRPLCLHPRSTAFSPRAPPPRPRTTTARTTRAVAVASTRRSPSSAPPVAPPVAAPAVGSCRGLFPCPSTDGREPRCPESSPLAPSHAGGHPRFLCYHAQTDAMPLTPSDLLEKAAQIGACAYIPFVFLFPKRSREH